MTSLNGNARTDGSAERFESASRQNGFTFLRLCAAGFVLVTHSYVLLERGNDPLARLTRYVPFSALGVDVFFAISGYLICQSLLRQPSPRAYLINRCLRILPALAMVIVVTTFAIGPLLTSRSEYWQSGQTYYFLLGIFIYPWQGFLPGVFAGNPVQVVNGSLWTLPLEWTCYMLLLAVSWCGALNWRSLVLLTGGSLVIHLADPFLTHQLIVGMEFLHLNRLSTIFFGGALLATLGSRVTYSQTAAAVAVVLILVALWCGQIYWHRFAAVYILLLPYVVVTIALSLRRLGWLNRWDISYGFYLYAFVVQQCVIFGFGREISVFHLTAISVIGTAFCGILSWFFVEKPALALRGRQWLWRPGIRSRATARRL